MDILLGPEPPSGPHRTRKAMVIARIEDAREIVTGIRTVEGDVREASGGLPRAVRDRPLKAMTGSYVVFRAAAAQNIGRWISTSLRDGVSIEQMIRQLDSGGSDLFPSREYGAIQQLALSCEKDAKLKLRAEMRRIVKEHAEAEDVMRDGEEYLRELEGQGSPRTDIRPD